MHKVLAASSLLLFVATSACKTTSAANGVRSAGSTVAGAASAVPGLVNVNLSNVLNNLALDLHIDKANIPINAQIPISVAANVCGVSVSALAASIASGQAGCTATTTSPQLTQAVQQQVSAGGSVTG